MWNTEILQMWNTASSRQKLLATTLALMLPFPLVLFVVATTPLPAAARKPKRGENTKTPSEQNYDEGIAKYRAGELDAATDSFLQATYFARNNYFPQAYYWLGVCYKLKQEDNKAIEAFNKHLEQCIGKSPDANVHLAEIYLRQKRLDEAEMEAKNALMGYPYDKASKAHNVYGLISTARGDLSVAGTHFLSALGDQPWTYGEAWMNYAENAMKINSFGNAIGHWEDMLKSDKVKGIDFERIYLNNGICYLTKGDHQSAIDNWKKCLSINNRNWDAHVNLAMLYDAEKHISSAIKEYREFIRLNPMKTVEDKKKVEAIKGRVTQLEHLITPQSEVQQTKPSVYMRQEEENKIRAQQEQQQREILERDKMILQPHESGF